MAARTTEYPLLRRVADALRRDRFGAGCAVAALAFLLFATVRIACTHTVLSHTVDEPNHIATGLEWLQEGTYELHAENPPLARIAIAIGLHLAGAELPDRGNAWYRGSAVLYQGTYRSNLRWARIGVLPFFLLAAVLVWLWTRRIAAADRNLSAAIAVIGFCTLPAVAANAGLATTDLPFLATFLFCLYGFLLWLEQPSVRRSVLFGAGLAAALTTKLSTVVFLPAVALPVLVVRFAFARREAREPRARGRRRRLAGVGIALAVSVMATWAVFRFSFGRADEAPGAAERIERCAGDSDGLKRALVEGLASTPLPAPELIGGAIWVCAHNQMGHTSYLLGEVSEDGFWYFYPVALAVKTPPPFLLLSALALVFLFYRGARERSWQLMAPAIGFLALMLAALTSNINIGLRHVLSVYPLLAVAVGVFAAWLCNQERRRHLWRTAIGVLGAVQLFVFVSAHPDYLGYFNAYAGDEPGEILAAGDLDWGQDLLQLEEFFRGRDVDTLYIAYFGAAGPCNHDLPHLRWLPPNQRVSGWIAISETYFRGLYPVMYRDVCDPRSRYLEATPGRDGYRWLDDYAPVTRLGGSIRVYHIGQ